MKEKSRESNFIRHWVRIKLEGFKPERIISEAIARGMTIRQIDYKDETEVCMTVAEITAAFFSLQNRRFPDNQEIR